MTKSEAKPANAAVNELFAKSPDGLREIVRAVMQEMLEAEMTDALALSEQRQLCCKQHSSPNPKLRLRRKSVPLGQCGRASLLVNLPGDEMPLLIEDPMGSG